ncbi:MAG: hypothetical protein DRP01_01275 [Archaeoglobales archaeon]|nr:MAG: hypothetical protein DRP01_01275 [Archaeoglobales archaeon]
MCASSNNLRIKDEVHRRYIELKLKGKGTLGEPYEPDLTSYITTAEILAQQKTAKLTNTALFACCIQDNKVLILEKKKTLEEWLSFMKSRCYLEETIKLSDAIESKEALAVL